MKEYMEKPKSEDKRNKHDLCEDCDRHLRGDVKMNEKIAQTIRIRKYLGKDMLEEDLTFIEKCKHYL